MLNILLLNLAIISGVDSLVLHIATLSNQELCQTKINHMYADKIGNKSFGDYAIKKNIMSKISVTQPLNLQVWQNDRRLTPPGASPNPNRPVGFASLSFTFENKTEQTLTLKLQAIEVRAVDSKRLLMSLPARDLILKPLEIAPQRYQLSNQEGYGNVDKVEALVIYQLDGQSYTMRSAPVNIR